MHNAYNAWVELWITLHYVTFCQYSTVAEKKSCNKRILSFITTTGSGCSCFHHKANPAFPSRDSSCLKHQQSGNAAMMLLLERFIKSNWPQQQQKVVNYRTTCKLWCSAFLLTVLYILLAMHQNVFQADWVGLICLLSTDSSHLCTVYTQKPET